MACGKTAEQKTAQQTAQVERQAAHAEERRHKEFRASLVGQATPAKEQDQGFFEIRLTVGSSQRNPHHLGAEPTSPIRRPRRNHAGTLAALSVLSCRRGLVMPRCPVCVHGRSAASSTLIGMTGQRLSGHAMPLIAAQECA